MQTGDLVKEKKRLLRDGEVARIGVIVRDDMSGLILKIQNQDGSWNGHHCITSPVFCTATSVLLLTVENDIDFLSKIGE